MITIDYYHDTAIYLPTSKFADLRKSKKYGAYLHSGEDFVSMSGKQQSILNLIDGTIVSVNTGRDYGKYIFLKHNPKFQDGVNDVLYSAYCHLSKFDDDVKRINKTRMKFVKSGLDLGKMGNTGNCYTKTIFGKWRPVTEEEVTNEYLNAGVHLHLHFFQYAEYRQETKLLKELKQKKLIVDNPLNYFWQWDKLFYNPKIIMKYFKLLQGRRII